jgi:hypothetical protein
LWWELMKEDAGRILARSPIHNAARQYTERLCSLPRTTGKRLGQTPKICNDPGQRARRVRARKVPEAKHAVQDAPCLIQDRPTATSLHYSQLWTSSWTYRAAQSPQSRTTPGKGSGECLGRVGVLDLPPKPALEGVAATLTGGRGGGDEHLERCPSG